MVKPLWSAGITFGVAWVVTDSFKLAAFVVAVDAIVKIAVRLAFFDGWEKDFVEANDVLWVQPRGEKID